MDTKTPRPEKVEKVRELKEMMKDAEAILMLDFTGLNVAEMTELRNRLKKRNIVFRVVKNTLARIAVEELGLGEMTSLLVGPNSIVVTREDPVEPIKIIQAFESEFKKTKFKGGFLFGKLLGPEEIEKLGKLPPKDELRAKTLGVLLGPINGLLWALKGLQTKLVLVLSSIKEGKEKEEVS
jgi:large subunit ribosomal protein L10